MFVFFIKLLVNKSTFYEKLKKNNSKFLLINFFANRSILLASKILLSNYMSFL